MLALISSRIMARTTLDLDSSIIRELRHRGAREHKSMGQVASELLARALREEPVAERAGAFSWRSADLGLPAVDLEDDEALNRVLDGRA